MAYVVHILFTHAFVVIIYKHSHRSLTVHTSLLRSEYCPFCIKLGVVISLILAPQVSQTHFPAANLTDLLCLRVKDFCARYGKQGLPCGKPDGKWLTGIRESAIPAGKVCLSPIADCFDGMLPYWTFSTTPYASPSE